jgi:hypothetical protein
MVPAAPLEARLDARADAAMWHTGDYDAGVRALLGQIATRRTQLYQQLAL